MLNEYQVLPFFKEEESYLRITNVPISLKNCFKVYAKMGELLPFICPVESANYTLDIVDYFGEVVFSYPKNSFNHKIVSRENKKYLVFFGGELQCLDLEVCEIPYRVKIGEYYSDFFWIGLDGLTKFELANTSNFGLLPYGNGFVQYFYLNLPIVDFNLDVFQSVTKDDAGDTFVKYSKAFKVYELILSDVPKHIKNVFSSFKAHESVTITTQKGEEIKLIQSETEVKPKRNASNFYFYDLEITVVSSSADEVSACNDNGFVVEAVIEEVSISQVECVPLSRIEKLKITC